MNILLTILVIRGLAGVIECVTTIIDSIRRQDSGTTLHIIRQHFRVHLTETCDVEIHLASNSSVLAKKK